MIKEFKDFILRGNVLELAVAVVIAGAFGLVVNSFTNDVLMPPIGMALGNVDFSEMKVVLQAAGTDGAGQEVAEVAIRYGKLVNHIISFLITAFALFMVVKAYNKANPPAPPAPAPKGPTQEELLAEIRDLLKK